MTVRAIAAGVAVAALSWPSPAEAADGSGGFAPSAGESGEALVQCVSTVRRPCPPSPGSVVPGGRLRIVGDGLGKGQRIVFRGAPGRSDDVAMRPAHAGPRHVDAAVPTRARTGPIDVVPQGVGSRRLRLAAVQVVPFSAPSPVVAGPAANLFPIQGPHDLGQTTTNAFGGGRGHQGADLFAECGTPLVVAASGVVLRSVADDPQAGNYAVIRDGLTAEDYVYMHMRDAAQVQEGDSVVAGQPLGAVGDSGNAQGCHLHFETWSAPGWQRGRPVDPLPVLRAWDADH